VRTITSFTTGTAFEVAAISSAATKKDIGVARVEEENTAQKGGASRAPYSVLCWGESDGISLLKEVSSRWLLAQHTTKGRG